MFSLPLEENKGQDLPALLQEFIDCLPSKPYCTNQLGCLLIRPKARALDFAYIQPNPIHRTYWLIFDIDDPEPRFWPEEDAPLPNMQTSNRDNYRSHLIYAVDPAVFTLRQAREKPLRFAADVERALTLALGADPGYSKLITKNPLHEKWQLILWREEKYDLAELLAYIPEKIVEEARNKKLKPRDVFGLGRNCMTFDAVREYAYSEWRKLKFQYRQEDRLEDRLYSMAMDFNNSSFEHPLCEREIRHILRSVCRWTTKNMCAAGFKGWGDARRQKSILTRQERSQRLATEAKALYAGGKTQQQIAFMLGINQSQVSRLLRS
jgi:hypothetical protein